MSVNRIASIFEHIVSRNLLLLGILFAIWMSMNYPLPDGALGSFDVSAPLVALIFVIQGIKMSFNGIRSVSKYGKMIGGAILVAIVAYPLLAHLLSIAFGMESDFRIGFLLLSSLPSSLEAAMAMAASAGGDPLTAIILLVALNLVGIASIPANLAIWLGSDTPVSEILVFQKLLFYLFLPAISGQVLKKLFPSLPERIDSISRYVPMICITALVYVSCSKESHLFHELKFSELVHIIAPCLLLHLIMLGVAHIMGTRTLKLDDSAARSFLFITSDKPMSLSVALWSMTYAEHHPLAIFPILVFYVGQVVFDSLVVSRLMRKDRYDKERMEC